MSTQLAWLVDGVPFGCIWALVAVGLVLTYKTTGVFNLAFSAQAFAAGAFYVVFVQDHGWPRGAAFVVAVFVLSPLIGLAFDRFLFRYMRTAAWHVKLVSALGLLVAIPEIVKIVALDGNKPDSVSNAVSIPAMLGIKSSGFHIGQTFLSWDQLIIVIITVIVVLVLGFIFRYTATGLQMRAVVESPRMVELAGVDSERVSAVSWLLSSTLAGLAGVMLAPLAGALDPNIYTQLIVVCIAAAVIGRLQSIPWALAGGVALGITDRALPDILQDVFHVSSSDELSKDLRPSLPFIVLFLVLVFSRSLQRKREAADPLAGVDPPPPAMAHTYKNEELARVTRILLPVFLVGFVVVMMTMVSKIWVFRITDGFALAIAFLSITVFTGFGGQISLAQSIFAGIGGFAGANFAADHGWPILAGIMLGAILAAVVGGLLAVPVLRLGGIYLTLSTLAFAFLTEQIVFNRADVSSTGGLQGIHVPRPAFANGDHWFFLMTFGVFGVVAFAVILIRKGTIGRFFAAIRGSETAASSIGINANRQRILLFMLSAGIAAIGGGFIAMVAQDVRTGDTPTFSAFYSLVWVVLVVTLGSRTVDGAVNAGLSFVIVQWLLTDALGFPSGLFLILFGLGAITYARHPEGIVEFQTRKSILATVRQRALNVRAKSLAAAGKLPKAFTPVPRTVAPAAAGPFLYFLYILGRSLIDGHWVAVHTRMLLIFVIPSIVYLLAWSLRASSVLRRDGGRRYGALLMLGGAGVYALVAWAGQSSGNLPGSALDCVLVALPAGAASAMFIWLPLQVEAVARARGWIDMPITWRDGRAPAFFVIFGAGIYHNLTAGTFLLGPSDNQPAGWPVCLIVIVMAIVWLQWLGAVQGAMNELAIGQEGEARQMAQDRAPAAEAPTKATVAVPSGGAQ